MVGAGGAEAFAINGGEAERDRATYAANLQRGGALKDAGTTILALGRQPGDGRGVELEAMATLGFFGVFALFAELVTELEVTGFMDLAMLIITDIEAELRVVVVSKIGQAGQDVTICKRWQDGFLTSHAQTVRVVDDEVIAGKYAPVAGFVLCARRDFIDTCGEIGAEGGGEITVMIVLIEGHSSAVTLPRVDLAQEIFGFNDTGNVVGGWNDESRTITGRFRVTRPNGSVEKWSSFINVEIGNSRRAVPRVVNSRAGESLIQSFSFKRGRGRATSHTGQIITTIGRERNGGIMPTGGVSGWSDGIADGWWHAINENDGVDLADVAGRVSRRASQQVAAVTGYSNWVSATNDAA